MKMPAMKTAIFMLMMFMISGYSNNQVKITGIKGHSSELLNDTLMVLESFAPIYECDRIDRVEIKELPADRIPRYASYRVSDENAVYERWDVKFCGKFAKFLVIFVPDPQGGTFVSVQELPKDAL